MASSALSVSSASSASRAPMPLIVSLGIDCCIKYLLNGSYNWLKQSGDLKPGLIIEDFPFDYSITYGSITELLSNEYEEPEESDMEYKPNGDLYDKKHNISFRHGDVAVGRAGNHTQTSTTKDYAKGFGKRLNKLKTYIDKKLHKILFFRKTHGQHHHEDFKDKNFMNTIEELEDCIELDEYLTTSHPDLVYQIIIYVVDCNECNKKKDELYDFINTHIKTPAFSRKITFHLIEREVLDYDLGKIDIRDENYNQKLANLDTTPRQLLKQKKTDTNIESDIIAFESYIDEIFHKDGKKIIHDTQLRIAKLKPSSSGRGHAHGRGRGGLGRGSSHGSSHGSTLGSTHGHGSSSSGRGRGGRGGGRGRGGRGGGRGGGGTINDGYTKRKNKKSSKGKSKTKDRHNKVKKTKKTKKH
jgi:hypothetical protein